MTDRLAPSLGSVTVALRRYAKVLVGDSGEADDLVQECLARALARAHLFRRGSDLRAWLFTILHNIHVNEVRRRIAAPKGVPLTLVEPSLAQPPPQARRDQLRDVERALCRLPDEQREVILLVAVEGMSYEEVAQITDVPIGTVMSRLSRARESLRKMMADGGRRSLRRVK